MQHLSVDPASAIIQRAYRFWAPVYDEVCGPIFLSTRKKAADIASRSGRRILEIGVGTGLSLGDYAAGSEVTGIDISLEMIRRARQRVKQGGLGHVRALHVMDAHRLEFDDNRFDVVVAQFLITLVERPEVVLDEAFRVISPGGELILVNHFQSTMPVVAQLEARLSPLVRHVGLRPDFPFSRVSNWIAQKPNAVLRITERSGPLGSFSIVRIGKIPTT